MQAENDKAYMRAGAQASVGQHAIGEDKKMHRCTAACNAPAPPAQPHAMLQCTCPPAYPHAMHPTPPLHAAIGDYRYKQASRPNAAVACLDLDGLAALPQVGAQLRVVLLISSAAVGIINQLAIDSQL